MNKKIVHDALVLTAFTLVLGFLLGVVYDITKEPIAAAEKAALDEAYKVVFADAASLKKMRILMRRKRQRLLRQANFPKMRLRQLTRHWTAPAMCLDM